MGCTATPKTMHEQPSDGDNNTKEDTSRRTQAKAKHKKSVTFALDNSENDNNSVDNNNAYKHKDVSNISDIEIENELIQDNKENTKREKRKQPFNPPKREVPFQHRVPDKQYDPKTSQPFKLGYEDEIYNGKNYGTPVQLFDQTWLTIDLPVEPNTNTPQVEIPPGWRIPTAKDYQMLIDHAGTNEKAKILLQHKRLLNMDSNYQYITSSKVFQNETNGHNERAWMFYCVAFDRKEDDAKVDVMMNFNRTNDVIYKPSTTKNISKDKPPHKNKGNNNNSNSNDNTEFISQMKSELQHNKDMYTPVYPADIERKTHTPNLNSVLIHDNNEQRVIFDYNPLSIYDQVEQLAKNRQDAMHEEIQHKKKYKVSSSPDGDVRYDTDNEEIKDRDIKLLYALNTYPLKTTLRCKLIADKTLNMNFKCDLVIERNYRAYFEVPPLYNITTFEWNFNDEHCNDTKNKSKKYIASHVFRKNGEYEVELYLNLFSNRHFHFRRKVWVIDEIEFGEDEIIDDVNYGQPIKLGKQIWLDRDLVEYDNFKYENVGLLRGKGPGRNGQNSYLDSICACPMGWRLPYKEEVEELLRYAGNNDEQRMFFFTLLEGGFGVDVSENGSYDMICLNLKETNANEHKGKSDNKQMIKNKEQHQQSQYADNEYDSSNNNDDEEVFEPSHIDPTFMRKVKQYNKMVLSSLNLGDIYNKEAYCLSIRNNNIKIGTRTTSLYGYYSYFSTRCIRDQYLELDLGLKSDSYPKDADIPMEINYPNVLACEWDFGDGAAFIKNEKKVTYAYHTAGDYTIIVKIQLFGNVCHFIKRNINIYEHNTNKEEDTKLQHQNDILIYAFSKQFKVNRVKQVHFSNQIAPICPMHSRNGFYIGFNDVCDNTFKLFKAIIEDNSDSSNDNTIASYILPLKQYLSKPIYTLYGGMPLDILSTPNGIALLLTDTRDTNTLYIQLITEQGRLLWRNNIMQNGPYPLKAEANQLMFFNNVTEKVEFGMNAMFSPFSGRLCYARGKILCIFSYMNNFGVLQGVRNDNNGDTIVTYSLDGSEVNLVSAWSTTHSLKQRAIYDGKYFYTASLGDAGPANVKVMRIEPYIKSRIDISNLKANIQSIQTQRDNTQTHNHTHTHRITNNNPYDKLVKTVSINNNIFNTHINPLNSDIDIKYEHYLPIQNKLIPNKALLISNSDDNNTNSNITRIEQNVTMSLKHNYLFTNMILGSVPGDLKGQTSGRFASITNLSNDKIALVYSRIPCIDGGEVNKVNEFSTVIFNSDLSVVSQGRHKNGDNISCIKQARYGRHLFVMYSESPKVSLDNKYICDSVEFMESKIEPGKAVCKCFLCDDIGNKVSSEVGYDVNIFSPSDDLETLRDGSVVWVFADEEGFLYLALLCTQNSKELVNKWRKEVEGAGKKCQEFIREKNEKFEEMVKKDKEFLKRMGIDDEKVKRKIKEIEEFEKRRKLEEIKERDERERKKKKQINDSEEEEKEEKYEEEEYEKEDDKDDKHSENNKSENDVNEDKKSKKKESENNTEEEEDYEEEDEEDYEEEDEVSDNIKPEDIPDMPIYGNNLNPQAQPNNNQTVINPNSNYFM